MSKSVAYTLAKWFVEEIRGDGFYYPRDVANIKQIQLTLKGSEEHGTKPYTEEQFRQCTTSLRDGCHLTEYQPICENKDFSWMCDDKGIKGAWVVRRLIHDFFDNPPDCPPWWDETYDKWVRLFGKSQAETLDFTVYQGWDHRGPYNSGIHPDEFASIFGEKIGRAILKFSLDNWEQLQSGKDSSIITDK